jgi:hypothetical protein
MLVHAEATARDSGGRSAVTARMLVLTFLVALLGWATPARAETPEDPLVTKVAELEVLIAQHQKEKAAQALLVDAKSAAALYKEVGERADLTKRCLMALDKILDVVKEDSEKKSVLETVGTTGTTDAARIVKPYLRQPDPEKSDPVLLTAIRVSAQLAGTECVEPLLKLMEDSKEMGVAASALEALGAFGKIKNKRVKVLVACVKAVQRVQPGGVTKPKTGQPDPSGNTGYTSGDGGPSARWGALAPLLPKTLNQLTGQNLGSAPQWFQVVKDTRDLNTLFAK